jgi:hypothetical protein
LRSTTAPRWANMRRSLDRSSSAELQRKTGDSSPWTFAPQSRWRRQSRSR